ncbi:hypothetical protein NEIPOLOT_01461 [Neisseria polysaccharea ATCC 43768]|nr:hypothetical protein NEIPOLOT_01461 [Neisseria polysaccharea ATCC 43768]
MIFIDLNVPIFLIKISVHLLRKTFLTQAVAYQHGYPQSLCIDFL